MRLSHRLTRAVVLGSLALPRFAFAQAATTKKTGIGAILNKAMEDTACAAGFCTADNKSRSFVQILGTYTNGIIAILGVLFMVFIIWGGFKWMTAAGNEEQVTKAKAVMRNATIGLTLVILARVITTVFLDIVEPAVTP